MTRIITVWGEGQPCS